MRAALTILEASSSASRSFWMPSLSDMVFCFLIVFVVRIKRKGSRERTVFPIE